MDLIDVVRRQKVQCVDALYNSGYEFGVDEHAIEVIVDEFVLRTSQETNVVRIRDCLLNGIDELCRYSVGEFSYS